MKNSWFEKVRKEAEKELKKRERKRRKKQIKREIKRSLTMAGFFIFLLIMLKSIFRKKD